MKIGLFVFTVFAVLGRVDAQSTNDLVEQGIALEKQFKVKEALQKFEQALLRDSKNQQALWRASRMYSNIGGHEKEKSLKRENYYKAKAYAVKSIQLDPASIDARFSHIISLGLLAEIAGNPREKIRDAKIIRQEAEAIVSLDTAYAPAYFVLGKWHYELAKLSWIEQMACDFFFGGLPEDVSMEKASNHFKKASALDPDNILFLYGEASVYHYEKDYVRASQLLDRALALAPREPDDVLRKEKCQALRDQIRKES
jgi:tetratricopeptide (TPR) repeat protein